MTFILFIAQMIPWCCCKTASSSIIKSPCGPGGNDAGKEFFFFNRRKLLCRGMGEKQMIVDFSIIHHCNVRYISVNG